MKRYRSSIVMVILILSVGFGCGNARLSGLVPIRGSARRISAETYVDKVKGGWVGQMAGAGWGAALGLRYQGVIVPESDVPPWTATMVNQFDADDLYVEMTFLRTLEVYGLEVSRRQIGIEFANGRYPLQHANLAARENLRNGIAPPDSGHPRFNPHADDLDYQSAADFSGLIAPGMPHVAVPLGEKFGRVMCYGDGLYGGQFIGAMHAEAFFERDMVKVVERALGGIPENSLYHECISDVLRWHKRYPEDWTRTWHLVDEKYHLDPARRRASCTGPEGRLNLDAKLNGAYVVMGLLYGRGDPGRTLTITMRCGQDAGSNSATAAGVLFTSIGFAGLPETFTVALDPMTEFSGSSVSFPSLIGVCDGLAREVVVNAGGRIETDEQGNEWFGIAAARPRPSPLQQTWGPNPPEGSRFSEAEMSVITAPVGTDLSEAIRAFAPGWTVAKCGRDAQVGLHPQLRARANVLVTQPLSPDIGCVISRTAQLPSERPSVLRLVVGHDPRGNWDLIVRVNGTRLLRRSIGLTTTFAGWTGIVADLSGYAGQEVTIELVNEPTGWHYEAAYWGEISLRTE